MLQDIDTQIDLARSYLMPFWAVTRLPEIAQQKALHTCRYNLLIAIGGNQFCYDLERMLMEFSHRVKNAPAFIPAAMSQCRINNLRTCRELSNIRRDVDGVSSHAN